jgi:hypothetical protein
MAKKRAASPPPPSKDDDYFELIAQALRACASYKPKFGRGQSAGVTLEQFQQMYQADPFYNWLGLDSPLMYAAHKAAGGMTSIYRQLGIGCQWLLHQLLQDELGLSADQASWEYQVPTPGRTPRTLSLDGRIDLNDIRDAQRKARIEEWMREAFDKVVLAKEVRPNIKGAVFEVRQGYKSKDSKRQNADISNASNAYANLYVPVLLMMSLQIDSDVAARYTAARWLLLTGDMTGSTTESTYSFCREVLGYDLAKFFVRNSVRFRAVVESVLSALLGTT